jgi:hypothetical protein
VERLEQAGQNPNNQGREAQEQEHSPLTCWDEQAQQRVEHECSDKNEKSTNCPDQTIV